MFAGFGCKKNSAGNPSPRQQPFCDSFVPGHVLVGYNNTVPMEEVFAYANANGLSIVQMTGFDFTSPRPADSIPSLQTLFNSKPYINSHGFLANIFADYRTRVVTIDNIYWDMTVSNQQDWVSTKNALGLTPVMGDSTNTPYILLQVPAGLEKYWALNLRTNNRVKWTELDCYMQINLWH